MGRCSCAPFLAVGAEECSAEHALAVLLPGGDLVAWTGMDSPKTAFKELMVWKQPAACDYQQHSRHSPHAPGDVRLYVIEQLCADGEGV